MHFNIAESANELVKWLHEQGGATTAVPLEGFASYHRLTEDQVDVLWRDLHERRLAEQVGMGGTRLRLTAAGVRTAQGAQSDSAPTDAATPPAQYNTHFHGVSYGASVGSTNVNQQFQLNGFDADAVARISQEFRQAIAESQGLTGDDLDDLQDRADVIEVEARKDDPDVGKIRRHLTAMASKVGTAVTNGVITVGGDRLIELIHQWQTGLPGAH